jgi:hypothetical protein
VLTDNGSYHRHWLWTRLRQQHVKHRFIRPTPRAQQ